jgi:ABC-2 type transport system permease protein
VIFVSLFGNERMTFALEDQAGPLKAHTPMLAGFIAIAVISAKFFNLAVTLVQERDTGILKRFRGTPLPTWGFIAGHVGTSIIRHRRGRCGAAFPVKHLNDALLTPLNPNMTGSRIEWLDLLVITAWGLGGLLVALRFFRWTPRRA